LIKWRNCRVFHFFQANFSTKLLCVGEISAFRIWPGNQIYSASKNLEFLIGWPTVSNLDALYEHANFEPVTDSRWHGKLYDKCLTRNLKR